MGYNEITGDAISSKFGNQQAFSKGYDLIDWSKKDTQKVKIPDQQGWVSEEDKRKALQTEIENSFKCNLTEQYFLQEELPSNVIGDEL